MNGIEKEIDNLGRIVLPHPIRKKLGLKHHDKVLLYSDSNTIVIKKAQIVCTLCQKAGKIHSELKICSNCIDRIKSYKEPSAPSQSKTPTE